MNKKEIVEKLFNMQKELDHKIESLSECGCDLSIGIDLIDIALDILGVPKDNYTESDINIDNCFCRDFLYDAFYDKDVNYFIKVTEKAITEV